ncbi:MAG TPA: hypothetical protein PLA27_17810, partial [Anaerolineales bacterium]|nr:hypothetical protein [Anaerolineales bacterium]HQX18278.1 hypothetical protein [Anaerolineales bacterium]
GKTKSASQRHVPRLSSYSFGKKSDFQFSKVNKSIEGASRANPRRACSLDSFAQFQAGNHCNFSEFNSVSHTIKLGG